MVIKSKSEVLEITVSLNCSHDRFVKPDGFVYLRKIKKIIIHEAHLTATKNRTSLVSSPFQYPEW